MSDLTVPVAVGQRWYSDGCWYTVAAPHEELADAWWIIYDDESPVRRLASTLGIYADQLNQEVES